MKKLKIAAKVALWALAAVVVALLALPLWIGPVARCAANIVVPKITGTDFRLGEFGLNPYTGTLHVGDMQLANPTNFSEKNAVELARFDADLAVTSLFCGRKIRIESVELDGIMVYSDPTASNFRQIAENASGEPAKKPEMAQLADENAPAEEESAPAKKEEKKGKGVQIDRITVKNVTVKIGVVPVVVPVDIEINDIGKDSEDGATLEEAVETVYGKMLSAAGFVGGKLGDLGKGAIEAVQSVDLGAAKDAISSGDKDAARGAIKDARRSLKNALKGSGAPDKSDLKKAGDGLKDLFK